MRLTLSAFYPDFKTYCNLSGERQNPEISVRTAVKGYYVVDMRRRSRPMEILEHTSTTTHLRFQKKMYSNINNIRIRVRLKIE